MFVVAAHRCDEVFNPPDAYTLWKLPAEIEDQLEDAWSQWLENPKPWAEFLEKLNERTGDDLLETLRKFDLVSDQVVQFVKSIDRNTENIAAALYPKVGGDSVRASVEQALQALIEAHKIRLGDDGYRIPTPTEDDWETQRAALKPKRADSNQILRETMERLWQPQPSYTLLNTRVFKGSLCLDGRERIKGDIQFQVRLAEDKEDYKRLCDESRRQSQAETESVYWVIPIDSNIDKEVTEVFRSDDYQEGTRRTDGSRNAIIVRGRATPRHAPWRSAKVAGTNGSVVGSLFPRQ